MIECKINRDLKHRTRFKLGSWPWWP